MDFKELISLASPVVYFFMTLWLIFGHKQSGINDKFPCIVVRTRKNLCTAGYSKEKPSEEEKCQRPWEIRLVNIGRGPALVQHFVTEGLTRGEGPDPWFRYRDGVHTKDIDKVIGPEVADPNLQVHFAYGDPKFLRSESDDHQKIAKPVSIGIVYNDVAGRQFKSGIIKGNVVWDPPPEFSHFKASLWLRALLRYVSTYERTPATVSLWLKKLLLNFYKDLDVPNDEVTDLRDFLNKYPAEKNHTDLTSVSNT